LRLDHGDRFTASASRFAVVPVFAARTRRRLAQAIFMVGRHHAARLAGVCVRLDVHFMVTQLVRLCVDTLRIVDH